MKKNKNIALLSVFLALAILLSYIERIMPQLIPIIPGIKLGIANIFVVMLLYYKGAKTALYVNFLRIVLSALLFSGPFGMIYSFSGAILSFVMMVLFKKTNAFSIIGVSVIGSVSHNIGQIIMASFVIQATEVFYYVPVLIFSGVFCGVIIGFVAQKCLQALFVVR